jgi:electron transfer flavoprotein alpha subunit
VLDALADKLSATLGASRAAVGAGYVPNGYQVGQTPQDRRAAAVHRGAHSSAIHHLAGMNDSKLIVGIIKDEDAPIFSVADYVVGELFAFVPHFVDAV